jgi:trimethylamine--corrinoid protein Co-methyltransferase
MLSDWQNYEGWEAAGGHDALDRATALWQKALKEYEEPAMDPAVREALEAYVARRREAIGAGEP